MIVLGKRDVDYVNKSGNHVQGIQVYFAEEFDPSKGGQGFRPLMHRGFNGSMQADFYFPLDQISTVFPDGVVVGSQCRVSFNQYGNIILVTYEN